MRSLRPFFVVLFVFFVSSVLLSADASQAEVERLEGFVDGASFCELAGDEDEVVEIHLGPSLLSALARGAGKKEDIAPLLEGLRSISACVVSIGRDSARAEKASRLVREMETRLDGKGWERVARVRDGTERVHVFALNDDETVRGVTILVLDGDEGEVVFVNLAGVVDLARIGELSDTLHVPALDQLEPGKTGRPEAEKAP